MAENKKGFVLYADLLTVVEKLVIQDRENNTNYAGELFFLILEYVNDKDPVPINFVIELAFEPIKIQLKRDLKKYEAKVTQCSEAGKRSAALKKVKRRQRTLTNVKSRSTNPTVIDNVSVKERDIVNVTDKVIHIENAYEFLKENEKSKIEVFEMQNKKSFPNFEIFKENFNSKVIEESLSWEPEILLARLKRMNINWDKKPIKSKEYKTPMQTLKERENAQNTGS